YESLIDYVNWPNGGFGGFSFDGQDSALTWFRPISECAIKQVHISFSTDSDWLGHTANLQLYSIKDDWHPTFGGDGTYDFSQLDLVVGDNGPHDELLWEVYIPVTEVGLANLYTIDLADWGGPIDVGSSDFALVLGVPANVHSGQLNYSPFWSDLGQYHSFKYYHGAAGWTSRLNIVMMATVDYYNDPPPFITEETDLDDVYLSDDPGPYSASARIIDFGTDLFSGGLSAVELHYAVNGGVEQTMNLSDQIPAVDSIYTAQMTGFLIGDFIEYYFYAADNGLDNPDSSGLHGAMSDRPFSFTIREANPHATILLVDDNSFDLGFDYYAPIMDAVGWVHDYWDVTHSGNPSTGILSNYSTLLWIQGDGGGGILNDHNLDTDLIAPYLDEGGNFFLSSSEYLEAVEYTWEGGWQVSTHPFLRDYLHVNYYAYNFNPLDVVELNYKGVTGSSITGMYADTTLQAWQNNFYADMADPTNDADEVFLVYSDYDADWKGAGVSFDGEYKTVYIPWQFEGISGDAVRFDILSNLLIFFGERISPKVTYDGGDRYAQAADAGDILVFGHGFRSTIQFTLKSLTGIHGNTLENGI
ncbi:hypothetical protein HQ531_12745, partial [bacterium]|nr:hypothetical protein [bacterium]